jgi:hypothetical protein
MWDPCHHRMVSPQVEVRGDRHQIWQVAANILNKQSQTADRGGPPAWGLGLALTTPHCKKLTCYEIFKDTLDLNGFCG